MSIFLLLTYLILVSCSSNAVKDDEQDTLKDLDTFDADPELNKRSGQVTLLTDFEAKAVIAHNNARKRHVNTPSLVYDKVLEKHAIAYAKKLAETNTFNHDPKELKSYGEGENLYMSRSDVVSGICDAVLGWYNEIMEFKWDRVNKHYNVFPIPKNLGHFTQIAWAATKSVGCGGAYKLSVNQRQGKFDTYIVCRYKPAGNVMFEFPQNVHPLKPGEKKYFSSFKEVCGANCANLKDYCTRIPKSDCNRAFFGPYHRKNCPKLCGTC